MIEATLASVAPPFTPWKQPLPIGRLGTTERPLRIALLSPKNTLYRYRTGIFSKALRVSPLTLTTLAAYVPPDLATTVTIFDEGIEDIPEDIDADLIGMTVITGNSVRAYELATRYRLRGKIVVLGGPHISLVPDDAQPHADAVVVGYAEETWPQLLRDVCAGALKPRYTMDAGFSFDRLPALPFPRRDLLKYKGYKTTNTFEATRACIHDCEFCVVPTAWGRTPFQKPISHIVDDIKQKGAKYLVFYDLNLIAEKGYAKELFAALIPLKIKWFGLATTLLDRDPELLDLVARSGCKGVLIGFESVAKDSLADCNKGFNNPQSYASLIAKLHNLDIAINGTFVFGSDSDTLEDFDRTRDFIIEHKIDLPRFAILTPFPGTPLYQRLLSEKRIFSRDFSQYDGQHLVFHLKNMEPAAFLAGYAKVWQEVYSLPSIFKRTSRASLVWPLLLGANLGYRYYANNLDKFYSCTGMGDLIPASR